MILARLLKTFLAASLLLAIPQVANAQDSKPQAQVLTDTAARPAPAPDEVPAGETTPPEPKGNYVPMQPTAGKGMPVNAGYDFQEQFSETGNDARWMNTWILMPVVIGISLLVLGLLAWVAFRYRAKANAVPSKTTHNTVIEVLWTLVPVLILLGIAVPSISLLAKQYEPAPANALTVKVTGYQWYWGYTYPDNGGFEVISNMLSKEDARANGEPELLAVDNRMVVPVGVPIKIITTGADVIHSFSVPSLWFKLDAVPGRLNEKVLQVDEPGVYYGQCSELCGVNHGFMPIAVEALPVAQFNEWVRAQGGLTKAEAEAKKAEEAAAAKTATASTDAPATGDVTEQGAASANASPTPVNAVPPKPTN